MDGSSFGWLDYVTLAIYFGAMAALGPIFASKARTTEGYFLGDRSFPGWLVGFSMFATSISSVTFVAYPADAYKTAWYRMTPNLMLPVAVLFATFFFLPFFRRTHITSAYEYLETRFGPYTRLYAACSFCLGQTIRVSMILYLVSILVYRITEMNPYFCIVVGGVVTVFYTVLGGIRAVLWTDFIQALVLWVGGLLCLGVIIWQLPGGLGQIFSVAIEDGKFAMADINAATGEMEPVPFWTWDLSQKMVLLFLFVGLANWLYEYSANQNVIQRYAASKSAKEARIAMWTCCVFSVPTWVMFMFLGTALYVFYLEFPTPEATAMLTGEGGTKAEEILPYFVIRRLPAGITGLVIAGVLAAAMSSLSSSINSVSAVGLVDVYKRHLAPGRSDTHYVVIAKSISLALGVIMIVGAAILMKLQSTTLQDTATVLTALTAGGLLGLYLLGFFTLRGDDRAMLTGIFFTLIFTAWAALTSIGALKDTGLELPIHTYYVGLIGHALMFVIGYGLAVLLGEKKDRDLHNLTVWTQDKTPLD